MLKENNLEDSKKEVAEQVLKSIFISPRESISKNISQNDEIVKIDKITEAVPHCVEQIEKVSAALKK